MLEYKPKLISYNKSNGKHYLRGFLIGTKKNKNGWSVSKDNFWESVQQYKDYPFIVSPKKFDPLEHFWVGKDYESQLKDQEVVTKGKIVDILGPFKYDDGSDDLFAESEVEITDPNVSKALIAGTLPFDLSPFIWETDENGVPLQKFNSPREGVKHWKPVHQALVSDGAFGNHANTMVTRQCLGEQGECHRALVGSTEDIYKFLSSQIYLSEHQDTVNMDNEIKVDTVADVAKVDNVPKQEEQINKSPIQTLEAPKQEEQSNEDVEALKKELAEQKKTNQKLLNIHQEGELSKIFLSFENEDAKKGVFKKWIGHERFDELLDFYSDIINYAIPSQKAAKKNEKNILAGSVKEQETTFPLTGSSNVQRKSRLDKELSGSEIFGGAI